MAQKIPIIGQAASFSKGVWKGGIGAGALTGVIQGTIGALGVHPFFSRVIGGVISASIIKNNIDKRIILVESTKEGLYQLLAGD